jgi:metaxin
MSSILTVPGPIRTLFSYFPLYTHPPLSHRVPAISSPVLWIRPPRGHETDLLSGDVECLKWQAYLALRGFTNVFVRWDISPDGAIDGRLPNLHVPGKVAGGELLAAHSIASWVDSQVGGDALEGYRDQLAKDESHAWVSLLEGNVHAALVRSSIKPRQKHRFVERMTPKIPQIVNQAETPPLWSLWSLSSATTSRPIESLISPPPAPLSGFSSLIAPHGTHFSVSAVEMQYCEAISALSQRLRTDEWFLDSEYGVPFVSLLVPGP